MKNVAIIAVFCPMILGCNPCAEVIDRMNVALADRDSLILARELQAGIRRDCVEGIADALQKRVTEMGAERWIVHTLGETGSRELVNEIVARAITGRDTNVERVALEVAFREHAVEIVTGQSLDVGPLTVRVLDLAVWHLADDAPIVQSTGAHGPRTYAALSADLMTYLLLGVYATEYPKVLPSRSGSDVEFWSQWLRERRARLRWDDSVRGFVL